MSLFKEWLQNELTETTKTLHAIPSPNRKGVTVAMLRKKARDLENAIQIFNQFEMEHPANQKTQHTSDNSAISGFLN